MPSSNQTIATRLSRQRPALALAVLTLLAVLTVCAGQRATFWDKNFPDVICYWAAGKILASGQSPYDAELQTRVQHDYGWDKATHGFGTYDFLPYYYPPWFGLLWVLLVPLGYEGTKTAWFFLNVEMVLVTGYLLKRNVPAAPPLISLVLAPVFFFSFACVLLGQTALLVFFLIALAWQLLERRHDAWAGVVLAWLTIKPQLTVVLLLAILLWAIRQRRWRVVAGFSAALAVLCLASTLVVPSWLIQMLNAPQVTPSPTEHYPWIGNSWFLVLKSLGMHGWGLVALYLAVALPFLGLIIRAALNRAYSLADLLSVSVLAAFFVTPYARHYDFPILLIPVMVLLAGRLPPLAGALLVLVLFLFPYGQLFWLADLKARQDSSGKFLLEATYFWVPLLVAAIWFASGLLRHRIPQAACIGRLR